MDSTPNRLDGFELTAELSATELKIARLVICGRSNVEIGVLIDRAEDTVKTALRKVFQKTGTTTRASLVAWMYESGHVVAGTFGFPDVPVSPAASPPAEPFESLLDLDDPARVNRVRRRLADVRGDLHRALASLGNL